MARPENGPEGYIIPHTIYAPHQRYDPIRQRQVNCPQPVVPWERGAGLIIRADGTFAIYRCRVCGYSGEGPVSRGRADVVF